MKVPQLLSHGSDGLPNMRAKYGILDCDFYDFDETGFMMSMIRPGMVVTRSDRVVEPKVIQPGHREWATAICIIAGDGCVVPLVVKGRFHLASWYSEQDMEELPIGFTPIRGCLDRVSLWCTRTTKHPARPPSSHWPGLCLLQRALA